MASRSIAVLFCIGAIALLVATAQASPDDDKTMECINRIVEHLKTVEIPTDVQQWMESMGLDILTDYDLLSKSLSELKSKFQESELPAGCKSVLQQVDRFFEEIECASEIDKDDARAELVKNDNFLKLASAYSACNFKSWLDYEEKEKHD